jgi:hypothetical protein
MAWYIFRCQHGAGHQSSSKKIHWFSNTPSKTELKEFWSEVFSHCDDPCSPAGCVGGSAINGKAIERLAKLPASEHRYLLEDYKSQAKEAAIMLKVLEKTETEPEYIVQWKLNETWLSYSSPMSKRMANAQLSRKRKNMASSQVVKKMEFRVVPYSFRTE